MMMTMKAEVIDDRSDESDDGESVEVMVANYGGFR